MPRGSKTSYYLNKTRFNELLDDNRERVVKYPYIPECSTGSRKRKYKLGTQTHVASIIGASKTQMSQWITNAASIPSDYLKELGKLFCCDWRYLCDETDYKTKEEEYAAVIKEQKDALMGEINKINSTHEITKTFLGVLGYEITENEDRVVIKNAGCNYVLSVTAFDSLCISFRESVKGIAEQLMILQEFISSEETRIEALESRAAYNEKKAAQGTVRL